MKLNSNGNAHFFKKFTVRWFLTVRSECTCSWKSKAFFMRPSRAVKAYRKHLSDVEKENK